jgi:DNA-binding XRE family transcriptional regulator
MTVSRSLTIVDSQTPAAASSVANVIWIDIFRPRDIPAPPGFDDIDLVASHNDADIRRAHHMESARRKIAETYSAEVVGVAGLRLRRGWSQKRLADEIGTSQSHVARIEAGREDVLMSTARRLATALGVSMEEINTAMLARIEAK